MPRTDFRNGIFCGAAVAAAFLIVNPFVQMPFDDDFSYSFTVKRFLETGHILFNGWSAPVLVTHILWGALFAKLFGYSFVALRFSTLPFAAGSAIVTYLLARNARLPASGAILASLTLGLSPLFLPLALSFMTDIPALFYTLFSLYCLTLAAQASKLPSSLAWLTLGVLFGVIGGMGRQTVWLVPLCVIPYLLWLRRREFAFVVAAIAGWLLVFLDAFLTTRWFNRQPWAFVDPTLPVYLRLTLAQPKVAFISLTVIAFTTIMFALPAILPFALGSLARFWRERKTWRAAVTAVVVLALSVGISRDPKFGMMPWLFNIVTAKGVIGGMELSGSRAFTLPLAARGFVSALVLMTSYILAARCVESVLEPKTTINRLRQFFAVNDCRPILAIFGIAYFSLLIVRNSHDLVFDRYCLPLIPCLAIPLMANRRLTIAWPLLAIYIVYALASTQDNLALAAARRAAVDRLEVAGVPRSEIAAGLEYNFYTQLEEAGHINRAGITNPPHAFVEYEGYTPALVCRYRLEFPKYSNTDPSRFGEVDYISWLPPFYRTVLIDQFQHPWWLDPHRPPNAKTPTNFEVDYGD